MYQLVLASGSPRRAEILKQVGIEFTVVKSTSDEIATTNVPEKLVEELSNQKASEVAEKVNGPAIILGADTVVAINDTILGKPKDEQDAFNMISSLKGKTHKVCTGVTLVVKEADGTVKKDTFHETAEVLIADMSEDEINAYIATKEPMDKAGAYAIQGKFACYVEKITGDYYTIVGLPIAHVYAALKAINKKN